MTDSVFLDTNIIVFSYSFTELQKQHSARQLITDSTSFISTQVLQELTNTLTRKFKFTYEEALKAVNECCQNNNVHINTESTIIQACRVAERYGFSFYDSLIIGAALESNCSILYSEDLNHGQIIEKTLKIINPFL